MQIKVKDTRMHKPTSSYGWKGNFEIPVAEAKLVLVECKLEEALLVKPQDHWMLASFAKTSNGYPTQWLKYPANTFFKPVLISETEKIEDRDWLYDSKTGLLEQLDKRGGSVDYINERKDKWFKVLALPEHFSPKHLQAIVDGKMKDGDKVLVECEEKSHMNQRNAVGKWFQIRLLGYPNPHITLHKVEEKIYTREEVQDILIQFAIDCDTDDDLICYDGHNDKGERQYNDLKKWFEQNVK